MVVTRRVLLHTFLYFSVDVTLHMPSFSPPSLHKTKTRETPEYNPGDDVVGRGITEWQTTRPDLDSSGKEVVGRLIRLHEVILKKIDTALQLHELTYLEYAVLATLRVSNEPYGLAPGYLLSRLLCSSGGLSNLLKRLEKRQLIQRTADPKDGRGVLVKLTAQGQQLADQAMPTHAATELSLVSMLDQAERDVLGRLLSRMLTGNAPELMLAALEGRKTGSNPSART